MELPDFPVYLQLSEEEFKNKIDTLFYILNSCTLCGHECRVNRNYEKGICNSGIKLKISSVFQISFEFCRPFHCIQHPPQRNSASK